MFFFESPFFGHADSNVLLLVVTAQFQNSTDGQAGPAGPRGPGAKLGRPHQQIKSGCVDFFDLVNILVFGVTASAGNLQI